MKGLIRRVVVTSVISVAFFINGKEVIEKQDAQDCLNYLLTDMAQLESIGADNASHPAYNQYKQDISRLKDIYRLYPDLM